MHYFLIRVVRSALLSQSLALVTPLLAGLLDKNDSDLFWCLLSHF